MLELGWSSQFRFGTWSAKIWENTSLPCKTCFANWEKNKNMVCNKGSCITCKRTQLGQSSRSQKAEQITLHEVTIHKLNLVIIIRRHLSNLLTICVTWGLNKRKISQYLRIHQNDSVILLYTNHPLDGDRFSWLQTSVACG